MGIKTVVVYSEADRDSAFVEEADEVLRIGSASTNQSYLKMETIIDLVKESRA
jgi:acetyl/propionyl-CoA carboxylase alpha subunit